jgi:hypothetical protein
MPFSFCIISVSYGKFYLKSPFVFDFFESRYNIATNHITVNDTKWILMPSTSR